LLTPAARLRLRLIRRAPATGLLLRLLAPATGRRLAPTARLLARRLLAPATRLLIPGSLLRLLALPVARSGSRRLISFLSRTADEQETANRENYRQDENSNGDPCRANR
jgi:hypothetical protein